MSTFRLPSKMKILVNGISNFLSICVLFKGYNQSLKTLKYLMSILFSIDLFSSVTQSCPTLCNPIDCSTLGVPVHHELPEPTQTHIYSPGDAIQPFHTLSSPSPPTFNLSQDQDLFQWVSSSQQVAKLLGFQHQSLQWIFRTDSFRMDWLDLLAVQGTLKSLLQHTVQKHQFFCAQLSI